MPRYVSLFKYSPEGTKGFVKEKATGREAAVRKGIESVGGKLEALYWGTSGQYTGFTVSEVPDTAALATLGSMLWSTGAFVDLQAIEVLTSNEMDRAMGKMPTYRPPGG